MIIAVDRGDCGRRMATLSTHPVMVPFSLPERHRDWSQQLPTAQLDRMTHVSVPVRFRTKSVEDILDINEVVVILKEEVSCASLAIDDGDRIIRSSTTLASDPPGRAPGACAIRAAAKNDLDISPVAEGEFSTSGGIND